MDMKGLRPALSDVEILGGSLRPYVLTESDDIERVILLRSAELIEADIPPTINSEDGRIRYVGMAVIHGVTVIGIKLADRPLQASRFDA